MFLKFFSHTDSGIPYREFVFGKSRCDHSLDAAKCDRSSRWGKFNCIIQYIYQYLLQFCRITPYQWILYLILNFEINHSLLDAVFEHHFQIFFHLRLRHLKESELLPRARLKEQGLDLRL